MLTDKSRVTLFWFTIGMIGVVVVIAVITLIRAAGGPIAEEAPLSIVPAEITLCLGKTYQFAIEGAVEEETELTWKASEGAIDQGLFTADAPGDYTITVIRDRPRGVAQANVRVILCTPTPTITPQPTATSTLTPTVTPTPTPAPADPAGDVASYEDSNPIDGSPGGVDIRDAGIDADMRLNLEPGADLPPQLVNWAVEGETVLWIEFYQPIPNPPPYIDWLFALDMDGNAATGRPANSARINPDMGDDAIVGLLYNPTNGDYTPYFLVWDPAQGDLVDGPNVVRTYIDDARTMIALALPFETLVQTVEQTTGAAFAPQAAKGRAAALSFTEEWNAIDFYPDLP
jgi:hypothetical protein